MPFDFDDVVLAEGAIMERSDRDWSLMIGCGAGSSFLHGTDTQNLPVGRQSPMDHMVGIRTSDDLLALQVVLRDLRNAVATRLAEILPPAALQPPADDGAESD
jgi:hypothetical protein